MLVLVTRISIEELHKMMEKISYRKKEEKKRERESVCVCECLILSPILVLFLVFRLLFFYKNFSLLFFLLV